LKTLKIILRRFWDIFTEAIAFGFVILVIFIFLLLLGDTIYKYRAENMDVYTGTETEGL
jgi:hypothetical protein